MHEKDRRRRYDTPNELMADLFSDATLETMAGLKRLFDPEELLNPCKVLPTGRGCMEIRQAPLRPGTEL